MNTIERLEAVALSDADLKRMLGKHASNTKIIQYEQLKKYNDMSQLLPNETDCCIVLLQIEKPGASPVGHWITLLNHGTHYEHFDSYGLDPDEELAITHEHSHLTDIIKNTKKRVESSSYKLQAKREAVNTCGRHAVVRVLHRELEKPEYTSMLRQVHSNPDVAVTLMTKFL